MDQRSSPSSGTLTRWGTTSRFSQKSEWYLTKEHVYAPGTGRLLRTTNAVQDTFVAADTATYLYHDVGDQTSVHTKGKWVLNPYYGQPYQPQWLRRIYESMYFYRQDFGRAFFENFK